MTIVTLDKPRDLPNIGQPPTSLPARRASRRGDRSLHQTELPREGALLQPTAPPNWVCLKQAPGEPKCRQRQNNKIVRNVKPVCLR